MLQQSRADSLQKSKVQDEMDVENVEKLRAHNRPSLGGELFVSYIASFILAFGRF